MCQKHYRRWQRNGTTDLLKKRNICTIEGCDKFVVGHGWCSMHYTRWQRHGDPMVVVAAKSPKIHGDPFDRVMARTTITDGCWIWQGKTKVGKGYGRDSSGQVVHRIVYRRLVGPIPKGRWLHHECRNKLCVRPEHLRLVDSPQHGREHRRETCPKCGGSDFIEPSRGPNSYTGRRCRDCQRERQREWQRKRAARDR